MQAVVIVQINLFFTVLESQLLSHCAGCCYHGLGELNKLDPVTIIKPLCRLLLFALALAKAQSERHNYQATVQAVVIFIIDWDNSGSCHNYQATVQAVVIRFI